MSQPNDSGLSKEAQEKVAKRIRELDESLKEEREKVASLENEIEQHQREKTAEDIALMLAASGSIGYEDVIDRRDKLASSDEDLAQMKTSMQSYGPGKVDLQSVETPNGDPEGDSPLGPEKTSGELFPRREDEELPPDVREAEKNIQSILNS